MTDAFQKAIDQIAEYEAKILRLKQWVNDGDAMLGNEPRFGDLSVSSALLSSTAVPARNAGKRWGAGDFFNKPLATAARMILDARAEAAGNNPSPALVDEIHEALTEGSFDFGTSGAEGQKNSIRISLGKNSVTFVRLPNSDKFGLVEWYGGRARSRSRPRGNGDQSDPTSPSANADGQEETAAATAVPEAHANGG